MLLAFITLLIINSCSINKIDKRIKRIAVLSPNINLVVIGKLTFKNGYSGVHYMLPDQLYPCFPEDLLSQTEKGVLDYLISETITEVTNKTQSELIKVNNELVENTVLSKKLVSDKKFLDDFPLASNYEKIEVLNYEQFCSNLREADSLFHVTIYHDWLASLKALTPGNKAKFTGNVFKLDLLKVKEYPHLKNSFDVVHLFSKTKKEDYSFRLEHSVYNYVPEEYSELTVIEKWDYKQICEDLNVDALLLLDFEFFWLPWPNINPLSQKDNVSIELRGRIKLIDKRKRILFKKVIKAESSKFDCSKVGWPEEQNEFIVNVMSNKLILAKNPNCGRTNFSLENQFSDLYREAILDFLVKMRDSFEFELKN